jgi:hypothetical protein
MSQVYFLLWSNKHSMWWRPDARGYTANVGEAGLSASEAIDHVVQSSYHGELDKVTCMVAAMGPKDKAASAGDGAQ